MSKKTDQASGEQKIREALEIIAAMDFPRQHKMMKYLDEISWETEVWVAESPTHLIHFNGERFLGPYEEGD